MKVEWKDNRASVGQLELRVRQVRSSGEWCADAWVSLRRLSSEPGFESDAEARDWCERFAKAFAAPIADAARVEGAVAEREACAREADRFATIASGNDPDEDDYQRGAMNCAQSLAGRIRARSNTAT